MQFKDMLFLTETLLNSTVGTDHEVSLSDLILKTMQKSYEFDQYGTYKLYIPPNATSIVVTACGGGGGGGCWSTEGSTDYANGGGGGGGGAAIINQTYSVEALRDSFMSITIGKGGAPATTSEAAGTAGGSTIIGSFVTLAGGRGGGGADYGERMPGAGGAAGGTGGGAGGAGGAENNFSESYIDAEDGSNGIIGNGGHYYGSYSGGGGGGSLGNGGNGNGSNDIELPLSMNGNRGGGGGGGAMNTNGTLFIAGRGGDGYAKIEILFS